MKSTVFINSKHQNRLTVFSRTNQFGDGVFETIKFADEKLILFEEHFARLNKGLAKLKINSINKKLLLKDITKAIKKSRLKNAVVKIIISRGNSIQGYAFDKNIKPIRVVIVTPLNLKKISELEICSKTYSDNKDLAGIKHCNRLEQVLARQEVKTDGVMLNNNGEVISTTMANIFIIKENKLYTPDLTLSGIEGTRRKLILEIAHKLKINTIIKKISFNELLRADEVFITNSLLGINSINKINTKTYIENNITQKLQKELDKTTANNTITIKKKSRSNKIYTAIALIMFLVFADFFVYANKGLKTDSDEIFKINKNDTFKNIANQLDKKGWINSRIRFEILARILGYPSKMQTGYYWIKPKTSHFRLLKNFVSGNTIKHKFTMIEGKTTKEYYDLLSKHTGVIKSSSFSEVMLKNKIAYPYEGKFFPDTYEFNHNTKIDYIFLKAYKKMQNKLAAFWAKRQKNLPLQSPYEAIILASIIEKESSYIAEKQKIAGVFIRRLKKGMLLQSDPTVVYALGGSYNLALTKNDLKINSLFNTYKYKGLPPSAISSVSISSLYAALHPDSSENLYFVSKKDGTHHFSKTYKEHLKAVKKYLKK